MNEEVERLLKVESRSEIPYTKLSFGKNASLKSYVAWSCYTVACVVLLIVALVYGASTGAAFLFLGALGGVSNLISTGRAIDGSFDFSVSPKGVEVRHSSGKGLPLTVPYDSIERFEFESIGRRESSVEYVGMRLGQEARNKLNLSLAVGIRPQRTYLLNDDSFIALAPTSCIGDADQFVTALEHIRTLPADRMLSNG